VVGKNGIILLKYWLEVDMDEQTSRIEGRITDQRKRWKLSPMDLKSYSRWYDYSQARDDMFAATDSEWVPWFAARSNDKKGVRLNIIKHLLKSIPYEVPKPAKITLPKLLVAVNFRRNLAALTHDPAESDPLAGPPRFRRLRGQIAGSGRQSGDCGADGAGSIRRLSRGRWISATIGRRAFTGAESAVLGKRSWASPGKVIRVAAERAR